MRRLRLPIPILALFLAAIAWIAPSPALADQNCDDFDTHAKAQAYFESEGGSRSNNADSLDGDRDGIACERLIRVGPVDRTINAITDGGIGTASTIGLVALAGLSTAGVLWARRRGHPAVEQKPEVGIPRIDHVTTSRVPVPELRQVEATGILVITLATSDGFPVPVALSVLTDGAGIESVPHIQSESDAPEVTVKLPIGEHRLHVTNAAPYVDQSSVAFVATDDISRVTIQLQRPEVPASTST